MEKNMNVKRFDAKSGQWIDDEMSTEEISAIIMLRAFVDTIKKLRYKHTKKET